MTMLATPENLRLVDALCRTDFVSFRRATSLTFIEALVAYQL